MLRAPLPLPLPLPPSTGPRCAARSTVSTTDPTRARVVCLVNEGVIAVEAIERPR